MTRPPSSPAAPPARALVVAAHPDDIDFGAAGTVASWTSRGVEVRYCLCTSGEAGGAASLTDAELSATREAEQAAAAAEAGVRDLTFLRHPDGGLTASPELRRDIAREIRRGRPEIVIAQSPEFNWARLAVSHPDHRAAGEAALAAVFPDARNPRAFPELLHDEGLQPWTVRELWLFGSPDERTNHAVDVTEVVDAKLAALRAHKSQGSDTEDLAGRVRGWLAATARRHDLPAGRLAEAFQIVPSS